MPAYEIEGSSRGQFELPNDFPDNCFIEAVRQDHVATGAFPPPEETGRSNEPYKRFSGFSNFYLGSGHEVIVCIVEGFDHLVMAYNKTSLNLRSAVEVFNTHNILNILFPRNFPRIHRVYYAQSPGEILNTGTLRQRVNISGDVVFTGGRLTQERNVYRILQSLKLYIPPEFDPGRSNSLLEIDVGGFYSENYVTDSEGFVVFIDTVSLISNNLSLEHRNFVLEYMKEKRFSLAKIASVEKSFEELFTLRDP